MKNYTDINIILDRSGSMRSIAEDMQGGILSFIDSQKRKFNELKEKDPLLDLPTDKVSLFTFDNHYDTVFVDTPISEVSEIRLEPRGWTALLDAVGTTINSVGQKLSALAEDDRPQRVLFFIITDGLENRSTEFTFEQVKQMINHQRDVYAWDFVFLGTDEDGVFEQRKKLGISGASSASYGRNSDAITATFDSITEAYKDYSLLSRSSAEDRIKTFNISGGESK